MDRLLHPRGIRFRRRHAAQHRRPGRPGPPGGHQHDRAAVGRQRGLADRGRRGHVRRVPRLVRDDVLRPVPRDGAAADVAHRPRRGLRVPGEARRRPLAPHLGRRADRGQPARAAADRHRAGRPAARRAHQFGPELHRVILGSVPALRDCHRSHPGAALPAARGDVPVPENHRRPARAVRAAGAADCAVHRRGGDRVRDLDPRLLHQHVLPAAARAAGDTGGPGSRLARLRTPRGLRLRGHRDHGRVLHRVDLRRPLPQRDGVEHQPGLQPHRAQHGVRTLLAAGDDRRRRHLPAGGAGLPDLVVLRVPPAGEPGAVRPRPAARSASPASTRAGGAVRYGIRHPAACVRPPQRSPPWPKVTTSS